jgi:hypothetical protein
MGTSPVRHSAINRELRSVAELSHRSYRVKTRILLSASQPFWTRLQSKYAHCRFKAGPRDYSASRGSFEQASSVGIGLGIMAWPGGKFAVIHGVQLPAHRLGGDVNAELLKDPLAQIDEPPAHDAMDGRDWPFSIIRVSAVRCSSLGLDGWPGALRLRDPSGPWALNFKTQSRTICNVTPPIFAASVRVAPS